MSELNKPATKPTEERMPVSMILKNQNIKQLATNLELTQAQIQKANASALQLSAKPELKNCDPMSLVRYCYETARFNFVRDDAIYPVPYGKEVQAQIGYKGFRELAMRSGKYDDINASKVYDCDKIYRDRESGEIKVEFNEDYKAIAKAQIVGYLAYARSKDGRITNTYFMTKEQLEAHGKKFSKSYNSTNSVWKENFDKMAMKTTIKQLCQMLDQTPELQEAIKMDQIVINKDLNSKNEYLDNPYTETAENKNKTIEAEAVEIAAATGTEEILDDPKEKKIENPTPTTETNDELKEVDDAKLFD